jgi:hypothetical protein
VYQDESPTEVLPRSEGGQHPPTEPLALARYAERMAWDSRQHPAESRWEPGPTGSAPDPPTQTIVGLPAPVPAAPASMPAVRSRRPRWLRGAGIAVGVLMVAVCGLIAVKLAAGRPATVMLIHPGRPTGTTNTVMPGAGQDRAVPQEAPAVTRPAQATDRPPAAQAAPPPSPVASVSPSVPASPASTGSMAQTISPPTQQPSSGATSAATP